MRARPVRPNIYLPVVRFGVADGDWFTVLLISCASYLAAVPFGLTILYVPLQMWTWLLATAGSIAFFNYIRIGKRPRWLQYKLKALVKPHRQYRVIPNWKKQGFSRSWIIGIDTSIRPIMASREPSKDEAKTRLLLDENNRIEEARA